MCIDVEDGKMLHITLAKEHDLILIVPISANFLATLANGFTNCLLSSICLTTKLPIILAPAMNTNMWHNSITQKNVSILLNNGIKIIGPKHGIQACGDKGIGNMSNVLDITYHCIKALTRNSLQDFKIVVTSGLTREKLDPIRYITNQSSGKMGFALAINAFYMGADVTILTGPTDINYPSFLKVINVESADEMLHESLLNATHANIFISCAAVADYKPKSYSKDKIKKSSNEIIVKLVRNLDIVKEVKKQNSKLFCVAFAAETNDILKYGEKT